MIKKMATLLCLLSIIATLVPNTYVFAENADSTNQKAIVLQALGVDDAGASGMATNDYLISALSGFLYEKAEKPTAEDFAKSVGIMQYGEVYDGSKTITKDEALEYAIATLGYKEYAESKGEGGVRAIASTLGLIKGMGALDDETITVAECRVLLYNMLDAEPMAAVVSEGQVKHIIESDQTLLSKYRDVHKIHGVLTSDGMTSLDKEESCTEGYIGIDNSLYIIGNDISTEKLLGKNIEAYVARDDEDELTVLYVCERANRNRELVIDTKDISEMSSDYSRLDYYENNKLKKAKIADIPRVIFNGVFYGNYTVADFKPDLGNVRLLDNDNDGKYDVIFINSYETVVVDAVDTNRKTIHNKFKSEGNLPSINLDAETTDVKYVISDGFGAMDLADIQKADILLVAKSKSNTNVVIEILVSRDSIVGMLQSIDERYMELLIDDERYPMTDSFLRYRSEEQNIDLGNTYTFFMDALGNVAYWEKITEDGYAIVERVYIDWENEKLYASYMDLNSNWIDAPIAKKITVNETLYKDWEVAYNVALEAIKGCVVKLTFNLDGEIKKIETATETAIPDENKFTRTSFERLVFRSGVRAFCDEATSRCKYYLDDGAKLIILPENNRNKYGYEVKDPMGFFSGDTVYTVAFYDIDEFGFSKMAVVNYTPQVRSTLFVVSKIMTILDDGEVRSRITGHAGDFENITLAGEDGTTFSNVEKGDIIKVSVNSEGYADNYTPVFELSKLKRNNGDQYLNGTQYAAQSYMAGEVTDVSAGENRLLVNISGTEYAYRLNNTTTVRIYNPMDGIRAASAHDIMCGDRVFIHLSWGNVQQIVIHE